MKKKILLFSALFIGATAFAQQLPNPSFEEVNQVTVDRTGYSDPAPIITYDSLGSGWVSGNEIFKDEDYGSATNTQFAFDTTDAVDGGHALMLRTHRTTGTNLIATGNSGLGRFELAANPFQSVKEGVPFIGRPTFLQAKYKYYNNLGDSCYIGSVLTKWNILEMKRDTIGMAFWTSTDEVTTFTDVNIAYTYLSADIPDSISVMLLSSKGGFVESIFDAPAGQEGATMIIDDLNMDYTVSVNESTIEAANISVLNNIINIEVAQAATVEVMSLNGAIVYSGKITPGNSQINLNKTGLFIVNVTANKVQSTEKVVLK